METEVTLEKLVYEGDALGRLSSGQVVFVPWAASGDTVKIRLTDNTKRVLHGEIQEIIQPSPHRTTPKCTVFGQCGGCQWQHITLEEQRRWKQSIVGESLQRIGKLPGIHVNDIIGSPEALSWQYRNKVEWVIAREDDEPALGYSRFRTNEVVSFDTCWLVPEQLGELAIFLRQNRTLFHGVERVQVRISPDERLLLTFIGQKSDLHDLSLLTTALLEQFPNIIGINLHHGSTRSVLWGVPYLIEDLGPQQFQVSSGSFFQVNRPVTIQLLHYLESLLPERIPSLLDLYAGVGLFAIWFHRRASNVLALEGSPDAVEDAHVNMTLNGADNIQWIQGDVQHQLKNIKETFDVALVDPPRNGCHQEVIHWLNEHVTGQIVYISCNPATLARDLGTLCGAGWKIESVQPFDMFPQTYHVETVVSLKRI